MNDPYLKRSPRLIEVPDWEEFPPSLRPIAKLIFILLFPFIACMKFGAYLLMGALFLTIAVGFLFRVISLGPIVILVVAIITAIVAHWTFRPETPKPSSHLRGRSVERHVPIQTESSSGRGRSIVRRSVRSDGNNADRR